MIPFPFHEAKQILEVSLRLPPEALHVYVGLSAFLLLSLLRGSWKRTTPFAGVVLIALGAELWDFFEDLGRLGYWRWSESVQDFALTVLLPLTAHALGRHYADRSLRAELRRWLGRRQRIAGR